MTNEMSDIPIIKDLDFSLVKPGTVARFWVHVVSSGIGRPIMVPVMVARGQVDGPVLGLTAAVHGNELNGLSVIQRVFRQVEIERLKGILVGVPVVNVPGFLMNQRRFNDDQDLNRIMTGRPDGNTSEVYAYRIIKKIVRHFEYLLDLHTASEGRVNSYYIRANMNDPITAQMARLQNAQIIVNNEGQDGTLRNAASEIGIHAITVEAGDPSKFQRSMIRSAITGANNVLSYLGMTETPIIEPDEPAIFCPRSYWIYTNAGGILEVFPQVTERVEKGERIALVRNVFGDVIREYHAPENGIIIGRSINPTNQTGGRIVHLGIES